MPGQLMGPNLIKNLSLLGFNRKKFYSREKEQQKDFIN